MKMTKRLGVALLLTPILVFFAGVGAIVVLVAALGGIKNSCATTISAPGGSAPLNSSLFTAIKIDSKGTYILALSMLEGSHLESEWKDDAVGAGSYGPYQIQGPVGGAVPVVHSDITVAQAENPAYATNYMLSAYVEGENTVNPILWATNPAEAAEEVAYAAEKPRVTYYQQQGAAAVEAAYKDSLYVLRSILHLKGSTGNLPVILTAAQVNTTAGCNQQTPGNATAKEKEVLAAAESQIGDPYVWGGEVPKAPGFPGAFDCSGLTQWAFSKVGIKLVHFAATQWEATKAHEVPQSKAQPGFLIFFAGSDGTIEAPGHVGIILNPSKETMVVAPETGENVQIQSYKNFPQTVGITDPYEGLANVA